MAGDYRKHHAESTAVIERCTRDNPGAFVLRSCLVALLLASAASAFGQTSRTEGEALFMQIHSVLTHPRCLNCHPRGDSPKQGDVRQMHMPPITRGAHDAGPPGLHCSACHQKTNYS